MSQQQVFIQQAQIEEVLHATNIVSLIESYVPLKKLGANFIGLCPFHQEKTASFYVSPSYQNYHCFGCGQHGNAIRFLMAKENYSFVEAIQYLANQAGIELTQTKTHQANNTLSHFLEKISKIYQNELAKASESSLVKQYVQQRKLTPELIKTFEIGFVPNDWQFLENKLGKASSQKLLQDCGLIKDGEKGTYNRLRNRLIFSLKDGQGRYIGFAGRALTDDAIPKYLNPPETKLYKKSETFYGLHLAKKAIRKQQRILLVEGYLDVIRLHEKGWEETVATCGTAITPQHIYKLQRENASNVYCIFDGDTAGQKVAYKTALLLLPTNITCYIVLLPKNSDPDSYFLSHSKADFQNLLDTATFGYNFIINAAVTKSKGVSLEQKTNIITELQNIGKQIQEPIKQDLFTQEIKKAFNLSHIQGATSKNKLSKQQDIILASDATIQQPSQIYNKYALERKLLQYIILHPETLETTQKYVQPEMLQSKHLKQLYVHFCEIPCIEFKTLQPVDLADIFIEQASLIMYFANNAHPIWKAALNLQTLYNLIYEVINAKYKKDFSMTNNSEDSKNGNVIKLVQDYSQLLKELRTLRKQKHSKVKAL